MTSNKNTLQEKLYVPFTPAYSNTENNTAQDLFAHKTLSITDRIMSLYQQLYERKQINTRLLQEIEEESLETSSALYGDRYNPHLGERQRSSLEKRLDLLEKDKRSELVEYWRDAFKIKNYLLHAQQEYREMKNKRDVLL